MNKIFYSIGRSPLYLVMVAYLCGVGMGSLPEGVGFTWEPMFFLVVMAWAGWSCGYFTKAED